MAVMTKAQAVVLLNEGVFWAYNEGQASDQLFAAARALIGYFAIEPGETEVAFIQELWRASPLGVTGR